MTSDTGAIDRAAQADDVIRRLLAARGTAAGGSAIYEDERAIEDGVALIRELRAERARAAQAVREIVERYKRGYARHTKAGNHDAALRYGVRAIAASECLAAVEAQR